MTAITPLESIHKKGIFGDHHKKNESDLLKISEIKNLNIIQVVQYKKSKVEIKNIKTGMVMSYCLVPESEANIVSKKISISSPIGQGLLGKKIGEIAKINIPSGVVDFKVLNISRS